MPTIERFVVYQTGAPIALKDAVGSRATATEYGTVTLDEVSALAFSTGDVKFSIANVAPSGWLLMNDDTIGSANSGASFANAQAEDLFTLLYDNVSDTYSPLLTSAGGATTRGAQGTAAQAWDADCRITLTRILGRVLGAAGSGSGLTARFLGEFIGAETETPTLAKTASHQHSGDTGGIIQFPGTGVVLSQVAPTINVRSGMTSLVGSGTALNIIQPTVFLTAMIKL